ncbi:MAG TPA: hypothetical protein VMB20_05595 [Candidatus Acidoferrum sp.]|nr:hypothetical protein [Candidatus Acidoferrum sp.]
MTGTTTRVRSIGVVQFSLMYGLICAVFGIILGLILAFAFLVAPTVSEETGMPNIGPLGIVLFPILYAIVLFIAGFIEGLIIAALYNLVAGWIGGIEIQLEPRT